MYSLYSYGLLYSFTCFDPCQSVAGSVDEVNLAGAEEASSRPASAIPAAVNGAPDVSVQTLTEAQATASPQHSTHFQLPPDIAEPPDRLCSAGVQVRSVVSNMLCSMLFWH